MSSPSRTLGSLVRIPLNAWMSVCVYSVFVLGSGLAKGRSSVQGILPTVLDKETEVKRSVSRMPYVVVVVVVVVVVGEEEGLLFQYLFQKTSGTRGLRFTN
jgi:hypothetical protein